MWNQNKSLTSSADSNPYNIDYDALIKNINELNMIVGDGETKIEKTSSGARFKVLILYHCYAGSGTSSDIQTLYIILSALIILFVFVLVGCNFVCNNFNFN